MLSLFKEKILSVQDGLTASLKGSEKLKTAKKEYNAGARLLAKFQHDWEELHRLSEINAREAAAVGNDVEKCSEGVSRARFAVRKLNGHLSDLNGTLILSEKAVNAIGNIRSLIEEIEAEIINLEDLIEEEEHLRYVSSANQRLTDFRNEQLISLDALKESLSESYHEKQKAVELEKVKIQKKNFEEAEKKFLEDLNVYKETGELPKKESAKTTVSIEEVEIEQDLRSLQEYLET